MKSSFQNLFVWLFSLLILAVNPLLLSGQSAEGPCADLYVDFKKGTLNGIHATASMEEIKEAFPCFTGETEENENGMNCGGGVFFLKHYFNFYTGADFIRLRNKFTGITSQPAIGLSNEEMMKTFGTPDEELEYIDPWLEEKTIYYQYQKKWGVLVFFSKEGKVESVEMFSGQKAGAVEFCF